MKRDDDDQRLKFDLRSCSANTKNKTPKNSFRHEKWPKNELALKFQEEDSQPSNFFFSQHSPRLAKN